MMKIGLALGGGSVLGAVHIGVLRALEEREISISAISGTSVGALVAALYAFHVPVDEIEEMALNHNWNDISTLRLSRFSLFTNDKLAGIIRNRLGDVKIEHARIPLSIVATDIISGERVVFRRGSVAEAVRASACIPGLYAPVEIAGRLYVDGGLVDNVPVSALKEQGIKYTIAVDLSTNRHFQKPENIKDVITHSVNIAMNHATRIQTRAADLIIAPDLTEKSRTNVQEVRQLITIGYQEATRVLRHFNIRSKFLALLKTWLLINSIKRLFAWLGR